MGSFYQRENMKINEMTRPWESFLDPVTQSSYIPMQRG
jgi:hypothetical protein